MKVNVLLLSIAAAILATTASLFAADPADSVVTVTSDFMKCESNGCYPTRSWGSGVVIGDRDGEIVVATCLHNLGDRERCRAAILRKDLTGDVRHEATVIGWSDKYDVALLSVTNASRALVPVEIDEQPEETADVEMIGYPERRFVRVRTRLAGRQIGGNLVANRPTKHGQSGGGLFTQNGLAGLVKWTDQTSSFATPGSRVADMARYYRVRLKVRERGVIPPPMPTAPAPPFVPPPPTESEGKNPWLPDPATTQKLDDLSARLRSVEGLIKNIPAGAPGPPGPAGTAGAAGPIGPMGPAGVVTVILIGPDGKEQTRTENVAAGSTVRLNVTKFLQKE